MKKWYVVLIIVLILILLCDVTMAKVEEPKEKDQTNDSSVRLIARTTAEADRENFVMKGCKIIHDVNDLEDAMAIECPPGIAKKLENVEEDAIVTIMDIDSNAQINASKVWTSPGGVECGSGKLCDGSGVIVAVLDTGVDGSHPELKDSMVGGRSFVRGVTSYTDDHGHGTHVAGIITANGVNPYAKGVAPGAGIWAGKVLDKDGRGYVTDIAAAINYVVKNKKARIISMSLGGGGTSLGSCDYDYLAYTANKAVNKGVIVVAAAGNTPGIIASPGCGSKVVAVGAVDDNDARATFSGSGWALDIVAPGVTILSATPANTYRSMSGTSMATPHVSATAAMILQKQPGATVGTVTNYLYSCGKDLGAPYLDIYYGFGRLDAYCSVQAA